MGHALSDIPSAAPGFGASNAAKSFGKSRVGRCSVQLRLILDYEVLRHFARDPDCESGNIASRLPVRDDQSMDLYCETIWAFDLPIARIYGTAGVGMGPLKQIQDPSIIINAALAERPTTHHIYAALGLRMLFKEVLYQNSKRGELLRVLGGRNSVERQERVEGVGQTHALIDQVFHLSRPCRIPAIRNEVQ